MANSFTFLADLEAGRCSNTAEVYLLRFWEARIVSQDVDALAPTFLSGKDKSLGVLCPKLNVGLYMMWSIYWRALGVHSLSSEFFCSFHSELILFFEKGRIFTLRKVLFIFLALYLNSRYTLNSSQCFFALSHFLVFERMLFDLYFCLHEEGLKEGFGNSSMCSSSH
ncbi:hypothetical protein HID58_093030, partial [Brassica napus]